MSLGDRTTNDQIWATTVISKSHGFFLGKLFCSTVRAHIAPHLLIMRVKSFQEMCCVRFRPLSSVIVNGSLFVCVEK